MIHGAYNLSRARTRVGPEAILVLQDELHSCRAPPFCCLTQTVEHFVRWQAGRRASAVETKDHHQARAEFVGKVEGSRQKLIQVIMRQAFRLGPVLISGSVHPTQWEARRALRRIGDFE